MLLLSTCGSERRWKTEIGRKQSVWEGEKTSVGGFKSSEGSEGLDGITEVDGRRRRKERSGMRSK